MDQWYYSRPLLAEHYLNILRTGIESNLTIFAPRRRGKSMFLLRDFAPAAQKEGYYPVYTSLWHNPNAPHEALLQALDEALSSLSKKNALSKILNAKINKTSISNELLGKVEIEFAKDPAEPAHQDLNQLEMQIKNIETRLKKKKLLLMIDEIQHLATSEAFSPLAHALRTIIDKRQGSIKTVFTGSSRHYMSLLFNRSSAPFYHFVETVPFPDLDQEFIAFLSEKLAVEFNIPNSRDKMWQVFKSFDYSPFWMLKVINYLITSEPNLQCASKLVQELMEKAEGLKEIAYTIKDIDKIVFLAIANKRSPFTQTVFDDISKNTRYKGVASNVQKSLTRLKNANLISQVDRGEYYVEKPGLRSYLKN